MPSKQEILDQIKTEELYKGSQVRHFVYSIKNENSKYRSPKTFRKGDIVGMHIANKVRPSVVIKVMDECLAVIPLTTDPDSCHVLMPHTSRFNDERESFYTRTVTVCSIEHATENFMGVTDNPKEVNKAIKMLREFLIEML